MSFLRNYMEFVKLNEAHENYHLWSAFSSLAALAARRVWIKRSYELIYPNLYIVLVGPQGNRKTAAKNIAQDVLRSVGGITFSSEATTREFLIKQMEECESTFMHNNTLKSFKAIMVCVTELKEFLSIDPGRMINFLTAVYDQNFFDYSTLKRGTQVLTNPCVNMLACETPDWLTDRLKDRIVSGGFSRRVLYVYETEHDRIVLDKLPQELIDARDRCVEIGRKVQEACGEFKWHPEGREFYDHWYTSFKAPDMPSMAGYYESKHTLMLKVAMLVALSETQELVLTRQHMETALEFLGRIERNMPRVFMGGGRNELGTVSVKAMDYINKAHGPIREKDVHGMLWHDCRNMLEMENVVGHLCRTNKVVRFTNGAEVMLCAKEFLPSELAVKFGLSDSQQSLPPVVETKSDSTPSTDPPTEPSSFRSEMERLIQESQAVAPKPSSEGKAPSQKPEEGPTPPTRE